MPCRPWTRVAHRAHRMDRMGRMDARCRGIDAARSATNRNARHGRPVHVIIMPGFLIPSTAPAYQRLSRAIDAFLDGHGPHTVDVVSMGLVDWLKIALFGHDFRDYLEKAARLVESTDPDDAVVIVGHSAGGWVARLLLGVGVGAGVGAGAGADTVTYNGFQRPGLRQRVKRLVTLGTPHYSKEAYPFGRVKERVYPGGDEGGGAFSGRVFDSSLAFTNEFFGEARDLAPTEVVSFLGIVDGDEPTLVSRVSYAANAGAYEPGMKGDGVVPIDVAALAGITLRLIPRCSHFQYDRFVARFGAYLLADVGDS